MTKAALRRQEAEREAREAAQAQQEITETGNGVRLQPTLPRMDPPPPYDEAHLPQHIRNQRRARDSSSDEESGCLNTGPGKVTGCLNVSTGRKGDDFVVDGCLNYDSREGCLNYESEAGCLNYRSSEGCLNYYSDSGCLNWRNRRST